MESQQLKAYTVCQPGKPDSVRIARNAFDALDAQLEEIAVVSPSGELVIPSCSIAIARRSHVFDSLARGRGDDRRRVCNHRDALVMRTADVHPREARMHDLFPGKIRIENVPTRQHLRNRERVVIERVIDAVLVEVSIAKGSRHD